MALTCCRHDFHQCKIILLFTRNSIDAINSSLEINPLIKKSKYRFYPNKPTRLTSRCKNGSHVKGKSVMFMVVIGKKV